MFTKSGFSQTKDRNENDSHHMPSYPVRGFVVIDISSSWSRLGCPSDLGKNDTLLKEKDFAMVLGKAVNDSQVPNTQHPAQLSTAPLHNAINQSRTPHVTMNTKIDVLSDNYNKPIVQPTQ